MSDAVAHLIFDVESIADGELISAVRYPDEKLTPDEAIAKYQAERLEQTGSTFIPHTFMVPISVVIAKVTADFRLLDIKSLDEPHFRPHVMTKHFWHGWEVYNMPQWVTFNGRSFDIPLMELAAFRFGLSVPKWFDDSGYKSRRNRFSTGSHLDLQELLTNFSAARFNGGLNLAAQSLGKPGKMGLSGDQVQAYYDRGDLKAISDYCRCDVLDTYFVFLRCMVMTGRLSLADETKLIQQAREWIECQAQTCQACSDYMDHWSEWKNPWQPDEDEALAAATVLPTEHETDAPPAPPQASEEKPAKKDEAAT
ncbi:3'-5' exonuclease [Aporhodopirellula aestuarii]|uniref:3'-5' exonuclease n=1 Tax=Aporhodopirellula aestuarii TaxID=2950107 RepID=A0ABT0UAM0_9BACT|nr:3'-5' exonuclease [Aporhodopirellula aestuarii]MCM2373376.1 3'-5' exonuclease [Aporhodopirellula aestuarii]